MKLKTIDPKTFITPDRIDIAAKILYAKKKILNDENYLNEERIYLNSIKYINGFVENDNSKKIGKKEFLKRFNKLIYTVYKKGFDKKFPVLINKKTKKLVDGAHRVATAIASNKKKIYVKEVDISNVTINYDSLFGNSMPRNLLEELIYYFCKLEKKTRIIFIWPNLNFEKEKNFLFNTIKKYAEIIYSNKIITTDRGKINLIKYIYNNEKWVHDDRKFDTGPLNKSFSCFKNKNFFHFIIIKKKKNLLALKKILRKKYKVGKHSLHINDTYSETVNTLQMLLNKNSLDNMNYKLNKEFSWHNRLHNEFKKWIKNNNYSIEDLCIEGSAVLSAYGLREARDLDYISNPNIKKTLRLKEISNSNTSNKNYFKNIFELIYNPNNFFYFKGLKYLSLDKLKFKKKLRKETKDIEDLKLINCLKKKNLYLPSFNILDLLNYFFLKNKFKFFLLKLRFFLYKLIY